MQWRENCRVGLANEQITGEAVTMAITPIAFIILENEIRETAKDTFEYFKQQGRN